MNQQLIDQFVQEHLSKVNLKRPRVVVEVEKETDKLDCVKNAFVRGKDGNAELIATTLFKGINRKYTGLPYVSHMREIEYLYNCFFDKQVYTSEGVQYAISVDDVEMHKDIIWLHDVKEDCGVPNGLITMYCGRQVECGVDWLTDVEVGNRAERKAEARIRISNAPPMIQNIKCLDLLSNTPSIIQHDEKFSKVFVREVELLIEESLTKADVRLVNSLKHILAQNPWPFPF